MTAALVDDLAGVGTEFEKSCEVCGNIAEWMAWAKHPHSHNETSAFECDAHKEESENSWVQALDEGMQCSCGHFHTGQLSDNFRAIRL